MAWTLCTEQDVRDIQAIPESIPDSWSELVEGMIREYTGWTKLGLTAADFTEYYSGDNTNFLRLRKSPVVSVASLSVSDVAVSSSDFYVGSYFVQLTSGSYFTTGVRNVAITYSAGGGDVPQDVRMSAAMMVVAVNNYFGRGGADASLKWATMSESGDRGGEDSPTKKLGLAGHLQGIMDTTILQRRLKIA